MRNASSRSVSGMWATVRQTRWPARSRLTITTSSGSQEVMTSGRVAGEDHLELGSPLNLSTEMADEGVLQLRVQVGLGLLNHHRDVERAAACR